MKKTDSGRIVFGGDGISPDERYSDPKISRLQAQLLGRLAFFYFAPEYFSSHSTQLAKDWMPSPEIMDNFRAFITKRGITFTPEEFEHDRTWIQDHLRFELFITAFSKEESDRVTLENDPEVRKAVDSLPSSKALLEKARQIIARQSKKLTPAPVAP